MPTSATSSALSRLGHSRHGVPDRQPRQSRLGGADPKRHVGSFEPAEETKLIFLNPEASKGKVLRISSSLDPK